MTFEWPWTAALRAAREDDAARQVLHLEALRTVQNATTDALRTMVQQVTAARADAETARAQLAKDREAFLHTLTLVTGMAEAQSRVFGDLVGGVKAYFDSYKIGASSPVEGHTHTDLSEYIAHQEKVREQAMKAGFPIDLGPEAQLSWVLAQTDK